MLHFIGDVTFYVMSLLISFILFINEQVKYHNSQHESLNTFVIESVRKIHHNCISQLILGLCGTYEYKMIEDVGQLFMLLLITSNPKDIESILIKSLQQDQFLLGDEAKNVILTTFLRCTNSITINNQLDPEIITEFFEKIWKLHQVEDTDSIETSDEVARFIHKYS